MDVNTIEYTVGSIIILALISWSFDRLANGSMYRLLYFSVLINILVIAVSFLGTLYFDSKSDKMFDSFKDYLVVIVNCVVLIILLICLSARS